MTTCRTVTVYHSLFLCPSVLVPTVKQRIFTATAITQYHVEPSRNSNKSYSKLLITCIKKYYELPRLNIVLESFRGAMNHDILFVYRTPAMLINSTTSTSRGYEPEFVGKKNTEHHSCRR